jgi:hypothetical protein
MTRHLIAGSAAAAALSRALAGVRGKPCTRPRHRLGGSGFALPADHEFLLANREGYVIG